MAPFSACGQLEEIPPSLSDGFQGAVRWDRTASAPTRCARGAPPLAVGAMPGRDSNAQETSACAVRMAPTGSWGGHALWVHVAALGPFAKPWDRPLPWGKMFSASLAAQHPPFRVHCFPPPLLLSPILEQGGDRRHREIVEGQARAPF